MARILLTLFAFLVLFKAFVDFSGIVKPYWKVNSSEDWNRIDDLLTEERPYESTADDQLKLIAQDLTQEYELIRNALDAPLDRTQTRILNGRLSDTEIRLRVVEREQLLRYLDRIPWIQAVLLLVAIFPIWIGVGRLKNYLQIKRRKALADNRLKAWTFAPPAKQYQFELQLKEPESKEAEAIGSRAGPFSDLGPGSALAPLDGKTTEAIPELPADPPKLELEWDIPAPPGWNLGDTSNGVSENNLTKGTVSGQRIVGNYHLLGLIGEGSMARVYLAERVGPDGFHKRFAIKLLRTSKAEDPGIVDGLINEARAGSRLNHPNIVSMFDFLQDGNRRFLVMEYVHGITLAKLFHYLHRTDQKFPLRAGVRVLKGLCDGLAYIHQATDEKGASLGLIHRDLKPANILLGKNGGIKIADFGVSRATTNLNQTLDSDIQLRGTLRYMSPEQARCSEIDARPDLYALGAIMFEMFTLESLYLPAEPVPLLFKVQLGEIRDRLQLLQDLDPALLSILQRLLEREPGHRYQRAEDVFEELERSEIYLPHDGPRLSDLIEQAMDSSYPIFERSGPTGPISLSS